MPKAFGMFGAKTREQFFGLLVVFVALLVYANSLSNGFAWDDTNVIVHNPALRGSPLSLFHGIDTTRDYEKLPYYRPLTILTYLIEERIHGLAPFPMHLINLLLHSANAFLVYRLALTLIKNNYAALLAGLLFAVHPINTEAVDFISGGRNTMLACFFILTAYLLHIGSIVRKRISMAFAGAVFLLAGLFSKETALVILPFIIALEITHWRQNVSNSKNLPLAKRLLPYAVAASCYIVMRWLTLSSFGIQTSILPGFGAEKLLGMYNIPDIWARLLDNLYIIPKYLLTIIWPAALSPRYSIPDNLELVAVPLIISWILITGIFGWLLIRWRSSATIFGIFWLIAFWLPVSGIVMFPSSAMADRYFYIPGIGIWIIIADQSGSLFSSFASIRRPFIVAAVIVLSILAGLTVRRNMDWKSDTTLFTRFVQQYPNNAYGHAGLGNAYFGERNKDSKYLDLAESEYKKVIALNPLIPGVYTNMGYILHARGDNEGALYYYTMALGVFPLDKEARLNRGIALENLGRTSEALADFKFFLAIPGYELAEARPYAEARIRELSR